MADTPLSSLTQLTDVTDADEFYVNDGGTSKRITFADLRKALGLYRAGLTSDAASNTTTTTAKITGLDLTLPAGTYQFRYAIRYQAAATTTGVKFDVNHSGTVSTFVWNQQWVSALSTASDANADQDVVTATAGLLNAFASRAKGTAGRGVTLSVDTANADMLAIIEGLFVSSTSGNLELYHGSEVAAASTVKAGSSVFALRVA